MMCKPGDFVWVRGEVVGVAGGATVCFAGNEGRQQFIREEDIMMVEPGGSVFMIAHLYECLDKITREIAKLQEETMASIRLRGAVVTSNDLALEWQVFRERAALLFREREHILSRLAEIKLAEPVTCLMPPSPSG